MNSQASSNTSTVQSTNIADQAINGIKTLSDTFSNYFFDALQEGQPIKQPIVSNSIVESVSVDTIQNNLISSLGLQTLLGGAGSDSIENLTSQSSIESLQNTVLAALQTSLFSSKPTTSHTEKEIAITTSEPNVVVEKSTSTIKPFSFAENGLSLNDGFDVLNILHHVPFVSNIYQEASQQTISPMSKLTGSFLYGGTLGLALSVVDLAVENLSGTSLTDSVVQFDYSNIFGGNNKSNNIEKGDETTPNHQQSGAEYFSLAGKLASKSIELK